MSRWTVFGLGILARLLSMLAGEYALWLWRRLSAGEAPRDFCKDLRAFAASWLQASAASWCQSRDTPRPGPRYVQDRYADTHEGFDDDPYALR